MRDLWLYDRMSRLGFLNYRAKIMLMAFIGTHIPLITVAGYLTLRTPGDWRTMLTTIAVALAATVLGSALTLFVLDHLLRPVALTSRTLRHYKQSRETWSLPTHYTDEVGTLMADAAETLEHLGQTVDVLEHLDGATGLPNRKRLVLDLEKRMLARGGFAACAVRFATYTRLLETLDLKAAEAAAREIADRLRGALRADETLYRVGGGEFMFLTQGDQAVPTAPEEVGERLRGIILGCRASLLAQSLTIEPLLYGAVALFPEDTGAPETLIDHAIAAVALASDEMAVSFHSPATRQAAVERLGLEQDLRRALANDEFVLHYQPVIDLAAGRAVGGEALIRWLHPERGLLAPGRFLGAAESSGLIDPIGLWVMRRACLQIRDWNAAGLAGLKVAINLSARQFLDPHLVAFVTDALCASGIAADQLEIELTEMAAMVDHDHTRSVFGRLRDLGVSIAIDDFGTGYASMSYLRKLPFNKLKIDREFVMDVHKTRDSQAICGALVALGKGLGLQVLAEGTESEDEVRYLRARGCDLYQGYCFSRPLPAAEFQAGLPGISQSAKAMAARLAAAPAPDEAFALAS
jgi:EAL domain-containing protein (putative c-di-GMP-specific phosphodiesterase class I)/GGDEF domain-containing protein